MGESSANVFEWVASTSGGCRTGSDSASTKSPRDDWRRLTMDDTRQQGVASEHGWDDSRHLTELDVSCQFTALHRVMSHIPENTLPRVQTLCRPIELK